jgi:MaoC like domain
VSSLRFSDLAVGDELPTLTLPITATLIAAGAIATRDFMPVHHDRDYAVGQGAPDIFMNILSDTAYCSRFLTDWGGPDAMVKRLAIRLGVPVFPGHALVYSGSLASLEVVDNEGLAGIDFRATSDLGDHVSGAATVSFPLEA